MEHAQPLARPFPWRLLALGELVVLIGFGAVHFLPRITTSVPAAVHVVRHPVVDHAPTAPVVPLRPRSQVRVLVLNGNGVAGAAGTAAARLRAKGYRIDGATNAQRNDYATSMVMFVPGWQRDAQRLARDAGVQVVAPADGIRGAQLRGANVILLLGRT